MSQIIPFILLIISSYIISSQPSISFISPPTPSPQTPFYSPHTICYTSSSSSSSYSYLNYDNSLRLMLRFNGDYGDRSDYGLEYTSKNMPVLVDDACYFDGDLNYLEFDQFGSLGSNMTVSGWVRLEKKGRRHNVIAHYSQPGGFFIRVNDEGEIYVFPRRDVYGNLTYKNVGQISFDEYHHIVYQHMEVSPSKTKIVVYIDGELAYNEDLTYHVGGCMNCPLFIGTWERLYANDSMKGYLNELLIFSRFLNEAEIIALYNASSSNGLVCNSFVTEFKDLSYYACVVDEESEICTEERTLKDDIIPVISNFSINYDSFNQIDFYWNTNQPCTSNIDFYEDDVLVYSVDNSILLTEHYLSFKRPKRNTDYDLILTAKDVAHTEGYYSSSFKTNDSIQLIPQPQKIEVIDNGITITDSSWRICSDGYHFTVNWIKQKVSKSVGNHFNSLVNCSLSSMKDYKKKIIIGVYDNGVIKKVMKKYKIRYPTFLKAKEEGYTYHVFSDCILIVGSSERGVFIASQTLIQLSRFDASFEHISIIDYPNYHLRGYNMYDYDHPLFIERVNGKEGKPAFTQEQKDYIDEIAQWKINSIRHSGNIVSLMSPLKDDHWEPFVEYFEYCKERYIDFIPSLFGTRSFGVPFEYQEGWYMKDQLFQFESDEMAHSDYELVNILANGDFESGDLSDWDVPYPTYVYDVISSDSYNGDYCLELESGVISSTLDVTPNSTYRLTGYVKGKKAIVQILYYDENMNLLYGQSGSGNDENEWKKAGCSSTAPSNAKIIRINLAKGGGTSKAYFDDVSLYIVDSSLINVIVSDNSRIEVYSIDKSIQYEEGKDYYVIDGETSTPFNISNSPFQVYRNDSGSIGYQDEVLIGYNLRIESVYGRHNYDACCIADDDFVKNYHFKSIENMIDRMKDVKYFHISCDEIKALNRDSRSHRLNMKNSDLLSQYLNKLENHAKELSNEDIKMIIWNDMVSPYHNGIPKYFKYFGGLIPENEEAFYYSIDDNKLSNSIYQQSWWGSELYLAALYEEIGYFTKKGYKYIGQPTTYSLDNIIFHSQIMLDNEFCLGSFLGHWGHEMSSSYIEIDKIYADMFWNVEYKILFFDSFERNFNESLMFPLYWNLYNSSNHSKAIEDGAYYCDGDEDYIQGRMVGEIIRCSIFINLEFSLITKDFIEVKGDKDSILIVHSKKDNSLPTTNLPQIVIEWYDKNEMYISNDAMILNVTSENDYEKFKFQVTSPKNSKYSRLILNGGVDEHFWFDTVYFKQLNDEIPYYEEYSKNNDDSNWLLIIMIVTISSFLVLVLFIIIVVIVIVFSMKKSKKELSYDDSIELFDIDSTEQKFE